MIIQSFPFQILYWHLCLFQLENYSIQRYLAVLFGGKFVQRNAELRKKIVWTTNIKILALTAFLLELFLILALVFYFSFGFVTSIIFGALLLIFFIPCTFVFLIASYCLLLPVNQYLKSRFIKKAKQKLAQFPNLKIVGITGSYGKTTMKEVLSHILEEKFSVLKTPDNINTPIGIARLILQKLDDKVEIFVVEMGAYQKGDIRAICDIVAPHISVLTGINESHLERFGSIANTIEAKFEIVEACKKNGLVLLNADNVLVMENFKSRVSDRQTLFYGSRNNQASSFRISNENFLETGAGISFDLATSRGVMSLKIPLLGDYALATVSGAVLLAQHLGMTNEEISRALLMLRPVEHRLQPIVLPNDILIIDDSYNGNPDGARSAMHLLGKFAKRRKIYLTPGLVELGDKSEEIHKALGRELAEVADMVLLIRTEGAEFLERGLLENNFNKKAIWWFGSAKEAHAALPNLLVSNDVIVFQNDLPDNYL